MKKILDLITGEVTQAFVDCGYDAKYGKVTFRERHVFHGGIRKAGIFEFQAG